MPRLHPVLFAELRMGDAFSSEILSSRQQSTPVNSGYYSRFTIRESKTICIKIGPQFGTTTGRMLPDPDGTKYMGLLPCWGCGCCGIGSRD
jgi:hypothetical protein